MFYIVSYRLNPLDFDVYKHEAIYRCDTCDQQVVKIREVYLCDRVRRSVPLRRDNQTNQTSVPTANHRLISTRSIVRKVSIEMLEQTRRLL